MGAVDLGPLPHHLALDHLELRVECPLEGRLRPADVDEVVVRREHVEPGVAEQVDRPLDERWVRREVPDRARIRHDAGVEHRHLSDRGR